MVHRLRPPREQAPPAAKIPTHAREERELKQIGIGCQSGESLGKENDGSGCHLPDQGGK